MKPLSDREKQIATLIAAGKTNVEIAEKLRLQASTVKTYVWRLMKKAEVRNRTELAVLIIDNNRPLSLAFTAIAAVGVYMNC
jgi:DNA-binding NarL/FixJ family response regulator